MLSLLKEVDKYIKSKHIPFKNIEFSYTYLPPYINQAILNEMRKGNSNYFELGVPTYELIYDNNNNLCLKIRDSRQKRILIIKQDDKNLALDYKVSRTNETKIIKDACMLEYYHEYQCRIRNIIEREYNNLPKLDKIKAEYYYMEKFLTPKNKERSTIDKKVNYIPSLIESIEEITSYINYLYITYKLGIENKKENKKIQGISYKEPEKEPCIRKEPIYTYGPSKERVNNIIATDLRFAVLESYPYVYRNYAYNKFNKEISYMTYIYKISSDNYILIMEPYKGTKYTKIASIKKENITKEDFEYYIKYYLELSNSKCVQDKTIIRISHTTLEMYKRKIEYAIIGINDDIYNDYYKEKIRKLRER